MARHYGQVKGRSYPVPGAGPSEMPYRKPEQKPVPEHGPEPEPKPDPAALQAEYLWERRHAKSAEAVRKRLIAMIDDPGDKRHGTPTGYKYGCRCDRCVEAARENRKKQIRKGGR